MKLKHIKIQNFKSIGNKPETFNFSDNGLTLFSGQNGNGKTTLFSAISYVLFGKNSDLKASSKVSIPANELINDINKKDMLVEISLDSGYTIIRGLKPDVFKIIDSNGNNLADKSSKVIDQKFLENEILGGLDLDMFNKITNLSAKATTIPFLHMTLTQRKDFIENILDIRIIYYMSEVIKKRLSNIKLDISQQDQLIQNHKRSIEAEEQNITNKKLEYIEQKKKMNEYEDNKKKSIEEAEFEIKELNENLLGVQSKIKNIEKDINELECDKEDIDIEIKSFGLINQELVRIDEDINSTKNKMIQKKNEKELYEKNKSNFHVCGDCPKVKTFIGSYDFDEYKNYIETSKTYILSNLEEKKKINKQIEELEILNKKSFDIESNINTLSNDLKTNQLLIDNLNTKIKDKEKYIVSLNEQIEFQLNEVSTEYLEKLKEELIQYNVKYDELVNKEEQIKRIKTRVSDKSLKRELLDYYIPIFQLKLNELLESFMEDDTFSFQIELTEDFDIIGKKNGRKSNIFKLSAGQQSSVNFAFLFAFHHLLSLKNSFNLDILMIDEILDIALDGSRVLKVVEYLKSISTNSQVMLISHNSDLQKELFDEIYEVKKVNNFTTYNKV